MCSVVAALLFFDRFLLTRHFFTDTVYLHAEPLISVIGHFQNVSLLHYL